MSTYLTNTTNLTSVANAIRAKSGGSSPLAFPSGFVSEIGNIPSGGSSYPNYIRLYIGNFPDKYLDPGTAAGSATIVFHENYSLNGQWVDNNITRTINWTAEQGFDYICTTLAELCTALNIDINTLHTSESQWNFYIYTTSNTTGNVAYINLILNPSTPGEGTLWDVQQYSKQATAANWPELRCDANLAHASSSDVAYAKNIFYDFESSWEDD